MAYVPPFKGMKPEDFAKKKFNPVPPKANIPQPSSNTAVARSVPASSTPKPSGITTGKMYTNGVPKPPSTPQLRTDPHIERRANGSIGGILTPEQKNVFLNMNNAGDQHEYVSGLVPKPQGQAGQPNQMFAPRSSSDLQDMAGDQNSIERAALKTAITERLNSLRDSADYSNQLIKDQRVLEDQQINRTLSPFNGRTSYVKATIGRGRDIDDAARASQVENQLNSAQEELFNFDKLAPERQRQIYNELLQMERNFGLQQGQLTGNYGSQRTLAGQQFDQGVRQDSRDFNYQAGRDQIADERYTDETQYNRGRDAVGDQRYEDQFNYQKDRDARKDYESDRLFDYASYRDNVGDQKWQQEFQKAAQQHAQDMGYKWESLNQRERQMMAEQTARQDEKAYERMQDKFTMGLETFKQTGQMPEYMENFGINIKGFNNDKTKEAVSITFDALTSGEALPEDILKRANFEEQQGIIDKATADQVRETVYSLNPELSPASVAEQKAKQEKRQALIQKNFDMYSKIPSVYLTKKIYEWGKGKLSEYF